ncbi:TetR/AcrR family transcriptional regulator [Streptacidiphilus rugosus]|uniref:TetR/AcrR family transcriptional regulator n=1 Tax=Streptacidiphilus rugosus TaxID=405783 RepID=UPI000B1EC06B|nr:helix-turn-helix domain-containing protein [Streptacidiphilus rugosus]
MDDSAILAAAVRVMGRTGPARLTLALIAAEVGLVPGTLVQRFGSKRGLLLALSEASLRASERGCAEIRAAHDTPLDALAALVADTMGAVTTPEEYANHLAFLCADLGDEEFRALALAFHQVQDRAVRALVDDAVASGGLRPETEVATLAATVQAAVAGAGLLWAIDRRGTFAARRREALDAVLAPHLARRTVL